MPENHVPTAPFSEIAGGAMPLTQENEKVDERNSVEIECGDLCQLLGVDFDVLQTERNGM